MSNIGIIMQARLGSSRLPYKVLKKFSDGESILSLIVNSIKSLNLNIPFVVATSDNRLDDEIVEFCKVNDVLCFRGEEHNVSERFLNCANDFRFEYIVRVCADNPFFDAFTILDLINYLNKVDSIDYIGFRINSIPSIKTHFGFWAELVSTNALRVQLESTKEIKILEHVTKFIYDNPKLFNINWIDINSELLNSAAFRFTVDTIDDFNLIQSIRIQLQNEKFQSYSELIENISTKAEFIEVMKRNISTNAK